MAEKKKKIKGKITIEAEMCKSCGYCVEHCPKKSIIISRTYNARGYYPAVHEGGECTGCGICAVVCPEAIIEVWRD